MMDDYKIIVEQEHSTVMAHYDIPKKESEGDMKLTDFSEYVK